MKINLAKHTVIGWPRETQGLITWRISDWAKISTQLTGLKFCCDYMTDFSLGWNEIEREKSLRRIKMTPRTRIVKIGILLLPQFGLLELNVQLFWMVTAYEMMELKRNLSLAAYLSATKTYLQRKISWSLLCSWLSWQRRTVSYCLTSSAVKSMFSYSTWALKLERQWIRFSLLSP